MHPCRRLTTLTWAFAALCMGYGLAAWIHGAGLPLVGWVLIGLCGCVGMGTLVRLIRQVPLAPSVLRFWRAILLSGSTALVAMVSQARDSLSAPPDAGAVFSPFTTALYVASCVMMIGSLMLVPVRSLRGWEWVTLGLDGGTVVAGCTLVTWYVAQRTGGDVVAGGTLAALATILSPAFLVVLAVLRISFAGVREIDPRALRMMALCPLLAAGVGGLTPFMAGVPYLANAFFSFPIAYVCLALAASRQAAASLGLVTPAPPRPQRRFKVAYLLPYLAVAVTDGLLLASMDAPSRMVSFGAVVLTALVVARQLVTFRENHRLLAVLDTTVAELRSSEYRLSFQATHDGLTGLANRALLTDRLRSALAGDAGAAVGMALIDLDDFKLVNDRLGHGVGDSLLVAVAERLRSAVGADDTVSRLGGDEFAILLPDIDQRCAGARMDAVLAALAPPVRVGTDELRVRASVGLVDGWAGADVGELVRRADVAMYAAKERAQGGWVRYSPELDAPAADQARLAAALEVGLDRGDFRLVYQPVVTLPDRSVTGVEALVRWHDPERGMIPPDRFIPVAERNGLIVPLGRWVLREACRQAAAWRADLGDRAPATVSVNVSPRQLVEPDLVDEVINALNDFGLPPGCLIVEVTETAVFAGGPAVDALHALRELGVRVALDDFGTGHSSLGLLLTCPVDVLKVDKSFVAGVTAGGDQAVIVEFLARVAEGLHLDTVAEGVETAEQADRLHELGYRKGQGYLFSRPLPPDDLAELLVRAGRPQAQDVTGGAVASY